MKIVNTKRIELRKILYCQSRSELYDNSYFQNSREFVIAQFNSKSSNEGVYDSRIDSIVGIERLNSNSWARFDYMKAINA